jgi:hypothetical protein
MIARALLHQYTHLINAKEKAVITTAKNFASRLNHCLDGAEAPPNARERAAILSKMINIPRQLAWILLAGQQLPDEEILQQIANEFEVDRKWLIGEK